MCSSFLGFVLGRYWEKVLEGAKKVTLSIYNHIWTINLMKKYTDDKEIIYPTITHFATQFLKVEYLITFFLTEFVFFFNFNVILITFLVLEHNF